MSGATPMFRQYLSVKEAYPDAIVFFRMGDFYEMFFEDAEKASRILGITLTARGTLNGKKVPMCGVPHHSSKTYVARLVEQGLKVAICEQVEDPKQARGIVKREVIRVVTPGSVVDEGEVDGGRNIYMAALARTDGKVGLAHVDLSTGEFSVTQMESLQEAREELGRIDPAEVLVPEGDESLAGGFFGGFRIEPLNRAAFEPRRAAELLMEQLGVKSLAGFGCETLPAAVAAAGALVEYVKETQKGNPDHIKDLRTYRLGDYMYLDEATRSNLELLKTMRRQAVKGSLAQVLDRTVTAMGSRLLKKWIAYPLVEISEINRRLAAVDFLKEAPGPREDLREALKEVYDLERLNGKIALGRANPRDLVALKNSIRKLPSILENLSDSPSILLSDLSSGLDTLQDVARIIEDAIREDPPLSLREGGFVKEGHDEELDRLISLSRDGKSWIKAFAAKEQERTGIAGLKVGFNRVYGYYIEVSKSNLGLVPQDYIRKQTLVNGERYITEPLKRMEEQVLGAEERRLEKELEIFEGVRRQVAGQNARIRDTAERVAAIDVLCSLAEVAERNLYTHPEITRERIIHIEDGRHPVIEQMVRDEDFVPNDIHLDDVSQQVLIITGPNMAGKSTILRQTALTVLMAQIGSFVPAEKAVIGIVDRIFTRVGASDDLARGRSTFMVEMNETADILRHATPASLVILDEIGRGTSTYDGLSIAWAVAEALHDRDGKGVRTLFATHYHELTELVSTKSRVKNFNVAVKEWEDRIIFLRKMVAGGTSRSYGIQVARIAGVPEHVLRRATEILESLETQGPPGGVRLSSSTGAPAQGHGQAQLSLFSAPDDELRERIRNLDIDRMTPLDALVELGRLRKYVVGD
ncbi:MAG: DNA mismatch repair protein MutS [Deltaproteobacteria bacterium]|nr:DNA mismatch repair protein MutS [Deltaproteobacteria bacterium]MBW1925026.1 DNA mismatch repair protein MutS [Deltaproteobacteria bacterium]MBW1950167.1 DNA mismatch repair protein MutS [Deltaproteobacteria bacterium]MBW2101847.1 DNA mismatch repair protein MutS [Deltaproteobacteria bacterium]MBW2346556.1 DNA mismatch repair protein MutS [Deltaproteobacteria bacterium]